ncbi:conjugal transfer protein TraF [Vibrio nitrifigilis]|uniref:Conjugal transfer protein TraF n=1 Tax=Vibrio nitrifigilis TaxID=2789781 RepID=A0ABS0GKP2_9VIBR|nr:conjugal transfer protein TraF [Vibrio nitrifigilis]MBF9003007.1 conjugal transfer protein TraF [Vibrio nitrifigilis]
MKTSLKLAVITATTLASVPTVYSATWVADARGNAMGNTGVTTADYLLAPFYNPALTAVYKDVDDVGILLPGISVAARDTDESLSTIDDIQDAIDDFDESATQSNINDLNGYLDDLDGNSPLTVDANLGAAIALPMESLSLNLFARGYAEIIATPDVAAKTGTDAASTRTRYENSEVNLIAFGYTEVGIALAKKLAIAGQTVAVGISPKIQQIRTYKETVTVEDFDLSDYDESEKKKSTLNLDLGAVWLIENYRAGIAVKDLFAQKIKTFDGENTYHLNTQVTVSGAYVTPFFTAAVDMDLTKQKRYESSGDDTQFLRLGIEGDAWGWAQLRAGYEIDMKNNIDDSFTAGIGISPGDVVSIDVAGTYAGENQMGVSANLAFTF